MLLKDFYDFCFKKSADDNKSTIQLDCSRGYPLFDLDLELGAKVTQNSAQYPLDHVTNNAPAKFGVAVSNGLGDVFTKKTLFDV